MSSGQRVIVELTPLEAEVLFAGYGAGTVDDGRESLGLNRWELAAVPRVQDKLSAAVRDAEAIRRREIVEPARRGYRLGEPRS